MLAEKSDFTDTTEYDRAYPARRNIMKARKFIFTHAAVFAAGVALAMVVAQRSESKHSDEATDVAVRRSLHGSLGQSADAASSVLRERREERNSRSARTAESTSRRLAEIVRIGDPQERQSALMELVNRLGPDEFAAFADQYRAMDHFGNSRGEYELILRSWAKIDPMGALDHAAQRADGFGDTTLVLSAWAGNDAAAAERWALDHHQGEGPNPYLASVIRGIAVNDIAHATRLAESMPAGRERNDAMDAITRALFVQGTEAAMAYPASIQDPELRGGYISMIANRLASKDAGMAAAWLVSFADADSQNRGARRVAEALAQQDVTKATAWVRKLSPEAQAEAARGVITPMSSGNITATAEWVATLSGIPNYDRVVEEFVWSCNNRAPEQSAAWIQGIADTAQRTRLYHRMLGEWARRDANAVKNWVANNSVPQSVANRFNR